MKSLITFAMVLSIAAFSHAQQVQAAGDESGQDPQDVKIDAVQPVPEKTAKKTKWKKKPAVSDEVIIIQPVEESAPASPSVSAEASKDTEPELYIAEPAGEKRSSMPEKPSAEEVMIVGDDAVPAENEPLLSVESAEPDAAPVSAGPVEPSEKEKTESGTGFVVTKKHTVEKGETLWAISGKYYNDPFQWGKIYNANLETVRNPDRIYPKEEINIPDITEVVRPALKPETITDMDAPGSEEGLAIPAGQAKISPDVSYESLLQAKPPVLAAVPAVQADEKRPVPADKLQDFKAGDLSEEMPEDQKEWAHEGKIVPEAWTPDGVITGKSRSDKDSVSDSLTISGDIVKVKAGNSVSFRPGDIVKSYMRGSVVKDKRGNYLGHELYQTGMLEVIGVKEDVVTARIVEANTSVDSGQVIVK